MFLVLLIIKKKDISSLFFLENQS